MSKFSHTQDFHLHLVSDATCETLITVARAASARYVQAQAIEHIYPSIRQHNQLEKVLSDIKKKPGIVLSTLVDSNLAENLKDFCHQIGIPHMSILNPVLDIFQSYLGLPTSKKVGAQHVLNADYFKRIDALNFTLAHDDGVMPDDIEEADILLIGISRTSKTPTSIYLANRGYKTTNLPLIPHLDLPENIIKAQKPLIVSLVASVNHILHIRQNRLSTLNANDTDSSYVNRAVILEEIHHSRALSKKNNWPIIDVTRKSIEETAAEIMTLYQKHHTL